MSISRTTLWSLITYYYQIIIILPGIPIFSCLATDFPFCCQMTTQKSAEIFLRLSVMKFCNICLWKPHITSFFSYTQEAELLFPNLSWSPVPYRADLHCSLHDRANKNKKKKSFNICTKVTSKAKRLFRKCQKNLKRTAFG